MKNRRKRKPVVSRKRSKSNAVMSTKSGTSRLQPVQKATLSPAQEAHQITFVLMGMLKRSRLQFLIIAAKLTEFRDKRRYEDLHYKDMENYAEDRLGLRRASLYRYLQIYKWVLEEHSKWLEPKPTGFIPDFYDCVDLMWIEHELKRKNLSPTLQAELEALRKKALDGKLKNGEVDPYRKRVQPDKDAIKTLLMILRRTRIRATKLRNIPSSVIGNLDAAIETLENI